MRIQALVDASEVRTQALIEEGFKNVLRNMKSEDTQKSQ